MLLTFLGWLILFVGFVAFCAAFLMFEDEEGRWQNRIEKLWVTIDDRSSGSRTATFFGKVASIVTRGFDRIFGQKLLSFQFVGVSTCCSLAVLTLFAFLIFVALQRGVFGPPPPDLSQSLPFLEVFFLIAALMFSLLAALPSIFPSRWAVALSMIPAFLYGVTFLYLTKTHLWTPKRLAFPIAMLLSLLSDVLLLALVRFTIRWISAKATAGRIAVTLLIQVAIVYFLVLIPFAIPEALAIEDSIEDFRQSTTPMALTGMGGLNIFTGLASSVFLLALLFVLLHRITWPILSRLVYPLARYEVVRNQKVMLRVGTVCLVLALPLLNESARSFIGWLLKVVFK